MLHHGKAYMFILRINISHNSIALTQSQINKIKERLGANTMSAVQTSPVTTKVAHTPSILSLDGGGVRGLSSLLILKSIMEQIKRKTKAETVPRPCEYFDLICGTSTGGLIAIMLGKLGMTVQECINVYLELSENVFKVDKVFKDTVPLGDDSCRFNYVDLENAIKKVVKDRLGSESHTMCAPTNNPSCRTFVVAKKAQAVDLVPTLFRSYDTEDYGASECKIWEAARATSAAPTFFKQMTIEIDKLKQTYVDGGLGYNNPSQLALVEAKSLWPLSKSLCLVSIGTGRQKAVEMYDPETLDKDVDAQRNVFMQVVKFIPGLLERLPGYKEAKEFPRGVVAVLKMASAVSRLVTNSEDVHQFVGGLANSSNIDSRFPYYRFNVERQVGDIGLGDWKNSELITTLTNGYLEEVDIRNKKTNCVRWLIDFSATREYEIVDIGPPSPNKLSPVEASSHDPVALEINKRMELVETSLTDGTPTDALLITRLAEAYEKSGDVGKMIQDWRTLVNKYPDRWQLQTQLAHALAKKAAAEKTFSIWRRKKNPIDPKSLDYEIQTWKSLIREHPGEWSLQIQLANVYAKKGDVDDAITGWTELVNKYPNDWKLQNELSQAYYQKAEKDKNDPESLQKEINGWVKLVDTWPQSWELQGQLAESLSRKRKRSNALKAFGIMETRAAWNLLKSGKKAMVAEEIKVWEDLVRAHPESRGLQMQLEKAYTKYGNYDVAIDGWKQLVAKYPERRELAVQLRRAYERKNDLKSEVKEWEKMVKSRPEMPLLQVHLAEAYSESDDVDAEIQGWLELVKAWPNQQELRDRLMHACLRKEEFSEALDALKLGGLDTSEEKNLELLLLLKEIFPRKVGESLILRKWLVIGEGARAAKLAQDDEIAKLGRLGSKQ